MISARCSREGAGEGGDGAAGDDEKQAPAVKKSGDAAKAVADKTVEAAGFGIRRRQVRRR